MHLAYIENYVWFGGFVRSSNRKLDRSCFDSFLVSRSGLCVGQKVFSFRPVNIPNRPPIFSWRVCVVVDDVLKHHFNSPRPTVEKRPFILHRFLVRVMVTKKHRSSRRRGLTRRSTTAPSGLGRHRYAVPPGQLMRYASLAASSGRWSRAASLPSPR